MPQDRQWFIHTLRRLGYTEAAGEAERELPDPVSTDELINVLGPIPMRTNDDGAGSW